MCFDLSMCFNLLLNGLLNHLKSSPISITENHCITSLGCSRSREKYSWYFSRQFYRCYAAVLLRFSFSKQFQPQSEFKAKAGV